MISADVTIGKLKNAIKGIHQLTPQPKGETNMTTQTARTNHLELNTGKMCSNEVRKIGIILTRISDKLGWDLSGYGQGDVNQSSGNTYVWLEDYPVTPYISVCGDDEVCYLWSCPNCGEEVDIPEAKVKAEIYPKRCGACKKAV